ncbi:MAG TPA: NtaA/DmoA family FMN-dependent monooxygenase [Nocardia sp.]|uniref:NtaA/DmoA family FMN-dependent monooxygenase n=1 Tax=Nocardia sp. TaxID=1821 RepID=UPI002B4AFD08|nr:NtaA/DmoA family FMN-dependent monooxygenase [Nocardia sp.]HLS77685.1 NtaA/DmoA family FMN-dependent monooxygenase [Nocardia sp.]
MGTPAKRELHLGYMYWLNGTHWGGWRLPEAPTANAFELDYAARAAKLVEDAKFDFFFLGDTLPGDIYKEHWGTTHNAGRLEPFTLASQLALQTSRIGLVVTAHPTYYEPYILARLTASLDHLSKGRLSWNVVLGANDLAARNFSLPDLGGERRYARADEFIGVVRRLWDSIEDGAYLQDKKSGRYLDPAKIHRLEHKGEFFQVAGTLPMARPPQGQIPLLYAGASELSRELTARHCELNFTGPASIEDSIEFNTDVRARARRIHGRDVPIFFLPGISPIIGDNRADAVDIFERLNAGLPLDDDPVEGDQDEEFWRSEEWAAIQRAPRGPLPLGVRSLRSLSERVGVDLRPGGLEAAVTPEIASRFNEFGRKLLDGVRGRTDRTVEAGTVRAIDLLHNAIGGGFPQVIGTAEDVADRLIEWFDRGAADGFNINSPYMWDQLERFTSRVVPILQDKGLFRTEYTSDTFRGHFGLPVPPNQFATTAQ